MGGAGSGRQRQRVVREYLETAPAGEGIPPDAVTLDPDAQRIEELAAAQVPDEEIEDLFKVTDEMRTTGAVVLQFVRVLPVALAGYCGEMPPAEFTLDRVRKEFGVGTYRVRVMGPKGYVPGGGKLVIAPTPEKPQQSTNVEDLLAILKADKEKNSAELKSWAALLLPALGPVLASWLAPKKDSITELLQGMAALKGLTPEPKEPESVTKQLDNLAGIMERVKSISGGEAPPVVGSTWIDLIREVASGLKDMVPGLLAARAGGMPAPGAIPMARPIQLQAPPTVSVATPAADGSTTAAPASNGGDNPMLLLIPWLRATLESLLIQAARDRDPGVYAEVTVDNLPMGTDPKVFREFIERADWWEMLQKFDPRVSHYVGWFNAFRREVLAILKEDEPPKQPELHVTPEHLREPNSGDDM